MDNSYIGGRYQSMNKDRPSLGHGFKEGSVQNLRSRRKSDERDQNEEEEYDRRREEELRRQIQLKENEIQGLNKASDYLRSRLDQSVVPQSQRTQLQNEHKYASFGRQMPERDRSPIQINQRDQAVEQIQHQQAPAHIREHIANLQSDNASLMRRLNLVLQELDRVQKEKEDIQLKIQGISKDAQSLHRMINGEDNVDKVNKYMSDDLTYERDRNQKLKQKLQEEELYRNDLLHELKKIDDSQERLAIESQNLSQELQRKLIHLSELEKEHYFTQEKIKQINNAIESGKIEEMAESSEKSDLQRIVNQLLGERNDLLTKQDNLTSKYDDIVREISHDRSEMERHNRHHSKLVTAKIIFQELQNLEKAKLREGFEEFKIYCQFDSKCHGKLQKFAKVLESQGRFTLKRAMQKWYQNGLKPIDCKIQSIYVADKISTDSLLAKVFYIWRKKFEQRVNTYDLKTKAVQQIWEFQKNDSTIEMKRAFHIWKEVLERFNQKKLAIKKMIWKQYFNRLNQAMNIWASHSNNVDIQVRLNLLAQKFTNKQYLNLMFHNFRYATFEKKRKRLNILFHYVKSWKDYITYRKFLMGSTLNVMHFKKSCHVNILKSCFDAFRINKETEKFQKTHQELNDEERPKIEELTNNISQKEQDNQSKAMKRACTYFSYMANKGIQVYFNKWKQINTDYKGAVNSKIKDRIIKVYHETTRKAFEQWKVIMNSLKLQKGTVIMEEQQEMQNELTTNVLSIQKEIKEKSDQLDQSQAKHVNKCMVAFFNRQKQMAFCRWKDLVHSSNIKENGADTIIQRLRRRILRQAFDLYVKGAKYHKKLQIEEERCKFYNKTRDERLKVKVFNSWKIYKINFQKSKAYWYRIYLRMDRVLLENAIRKWKVGSQKQLEFSLETQQNNVVNQIGELNQQIGQITSQTECQQQELKQMKGQLTKQAQRIIANAFANYYYVGETRGFEKWKEFTKFEIHKEKLMKKMIDRWKKHSFYHVQSCIKNWMLACNIEDKKNLLKKEEQKLNDTDQSFSVQQKMFQEMKGKLNNELEQVANMQKNYNSKLQKSIQMIVGKVDKNHYVSQKRYILQQWRDYVKREKFFINCIQNVIKKSLWTIGFKEIKSHSRDDKKFENMDIKLNKFRQKFWKRTCGNAFSIWRSGAFKTIFSTIEETNDQANQKIEEHNNKVQIRKEVNSVKASRVLGNQKLKNVFFGWKNIIKFLKLQSDKKDKYQTQIKTFNIKGALYKWKKRKDATKSARLKMTKLKTKFIRIRKMLIFNAMKQLFNASKDFMSQMSILANIHDHQALKMGYNAIISFSKAKYYVQRKKKENSSKDIYSIFSNLLIRKKSSYFNTLKFRLLNKHKQTLQKIYNVQNSLSNKIRVYFIRWKEQTAQQNLRQEMHEEGPVREQVFEDRIFFENCKNFMKEEGYDQHDILEALKQGRAKQNCLLLKGVRRMQHYNQELYTKPKMFDRWKEFVHLRKLFRYWLQYIKNRGEYIKCDIAVSFDRWKRFDDVQKFGLKKLNKHQLQNRLIKNSERLGNLADDIQDKENTLKHLNDQREELVENYIKGQRLALVLWENNLKKQKHKALTRWFKNACQLGANNQEEQLRKNIELIAALKDRLRQLEKDNESYANENEELRQFSLDGYEIAKNVQNLTQEREKLSVDLADKAQTIRKLLDENEKLNKKLKFAQDEAQNLIKSTNNKFMGNSGKGMSFQSPAIRNNAY